MSQFKINLSEAIISQDLGIYNSFTDSNVVTNSKFSLDAFFIPTIGLKNNIDLLISTLSHYHKPIYVITSQHAPYRKAYDSVNLIKISDELHNSFIEELKSSDNPSKNYNLDYDLPTKRNLALDISHKKKYKYIALIDDDIILSNVNFLKAGILFENGATVVGYYSLNFPDKSVISLIECHLEQLTPKVSLSGNCLLLDIENAEGFFPYIYNEDWFFIIRNIVKGKVFGAGIVGQCHHEPWLDFRRIRFEQFGDVIAFGARRANITFGNPLPIKKSFWEAILNEYLERLDRLLNIALVEGVFIEQLKEAQTVTKQFNVNQIIEFLEVLDSDTNGSTYKKLYHSKHL